jgi:hypothetical protein
LDTPVPDLLRRSWNVSRGPEPCTEVQQGVQPASKLKIQKRAQGGVHKKRPMRGSNPRQQDDGLSIYLTELTGQILIGGKVAFTVGVQ